MGKGNSAPAYKAAAPPAYGYDPTATGSMEELLSRGKAILGGDIPGYYAPIGEVMPEMAESASQRAINTIRQQANRMGAVGSSTTLSKISDIAKQIQESDYYRALTGRQWLGGWGSGMVGTAGTMGLTRETAKAGHELGGYKTYEAGKYGAADLQRQAEADEATKQAAWMRTLAQLAGSALTLVPGGQGVGTASLAALMASPSVSQFGQQYGSKALSMFQ